MRRMAKIPPADLVVLGLVGACDGRDKMEPNFMSSPFFPTASTRVMFLYRNKSMALQRRVGNKQVATRYIQSRLLIAPRLFSGIWVST